MENLEIVKKIKKLTDELWEAKLDAESSGLKVVIYFPSQSELDQKPTVKIFKEVF